MKKQKIAKRLMSLICIVPLHMLGAATLLPTQTTLQKQYIHSKSEEKKYHWFEGKKISPKLFAFIHHVQADSTIVCKDFMHYKDILRLIQKYRVLQSEDLQKQIEQQADILYKRYQQIQSGGCFDPKEFLDKDSYIVPHHKDLLVPIHNPILSRLYQALDMYLQFARRGGWERIEEGNIAYLHPGHAYDVIPKIKKRLAFEGYYTHDDNSTFYGRALEYAIKNYQRHHNLAPDGIIGPATLDALNVPVEERIKIILINIERAKWFLQNDNFFVFVDIPGFFMQVYKDGKPIYYSRVVVGRKERPTPQMRNVISYAVMNPYWRAPKTIVQKDIWPRLQKGDYASLRQWGIVVAKDHKGQKIVGYEDVNWSRYDAQHIPYIFMQMPGSYNFLGAVKFMFPNRFDVYLHDTNHKNLFSYRYRALSSGCIRVHRPLELLHLLRTYTRGAPLRYRDILDILQKGERRVVTFRPVIPVYLLYLTVFMDDQRKVYFFQDIYGLDKKMLASLPKLDTIAQEHQEVGEFHE